MKKLINNYGVIILALFLIYNIILNNLIIGGLVYKIIMIILIFTNSIILIVHRKDIEYKEIICVIYLLTWLFSKNALQCYFNFSNIIVLCAIGFIESKFIKVFSIIISLLIIVFFLPLYFIFLMTFGTSMNERYDRRNIYDNMHYYCDNNYEIYSFSAGAMDSYHYSIGKHYEILNIDGIIYISYNERNEVSKEKYEDYLDNHQCRLVGEINGS